jgi:hypothetical protein
MEPYRVIDAEAKNGEYRLLWSRFFGAFQARWEEPYWVQPEGHTMVLEEHVSYWMPLPPAPE